MNLPILRMAKISKYFPGVIALDGVDFEINSGEVVAIAGENGAGKSTLMKILGGIYQPDGGSIFIDGKQVSIRSVGESSAHGIGFVHQELNVLDNLSIAQNIFLGREPLHLGFLVDRRKMDADARIYLQRLGLSLSPQTLLGGLSIAQKQLVEIAKTLSQNARILIMDEPTSSLTIKETEKLLSVIKELKTQGVSIIYISHRLGEIGKIADRVTILRDGKNAGNLEQSQINHANIVKMMVGRDLVRQERARAETANVAEIKIENLQTRRYPQHAVSFGIRKGEILGFAGLVGAGRSELAQAIFGVDKSLGGSVTIEGKNLKIVSAKDAIKHGIYLIPEDRRSCGLFLDDSICRNITLPALSRYSSAGIVSQLAENRISAEMREKLNIKASSTGTKAGNLSGGNQQKVVLAKWLSLDPKLLIFDEPTRGIDVGAKAEIYQLMQNLAQAGVAIMMISSDMEEILSESDRIAVMHEGRITGILERGEATEEAIMNLAVR